MTKFFIALLFGSALFAPAIKANIIKPILITGGAGYIGSATVLYMLQRGYHIIVLDKKFPESSFFEHACKVTEINNQIAQNWLSKNSQNLTDRVLFIKRNIADQENLENIFKNFEIEAVIHFAGSIEVSLSIKDPASFYENNVLNVIKLLDVMKKYNVKKFVFSSSAAVYGIPTTKVLGEDHPKNPINPYGKTKYMVELLLQDYAQAYSINSIVLRYFNAAGALPEYDIGERHEPETHVIPLLLNAAYNSKPFYIFGIDYPTQDGTPVRDYLHIYDLAQAHYLAVKYLNKEPKFEVFNLGTGTGYSVKQVIELAEKITQKKIRTIYTDKRAGDPARLVADSTKAHALLGWAPLMSSLEIILSTAHEFHGKTFKELKVVKEAIISN